MREYSPKRRTAVVFVGSGATGAYHAGALKALDESGVKVDLVVGSGVGTVAAAFAAVAGGGKLYGPGGLWQDVRWSSFYRLRPPLRVALLLLGAAFGVFLLPILLALLAGVLFPVIFIGDLVAPGLLSRVVAEVGAAPVLLRTPYLASIAAPVFVLSIFAVLYLARRAIRDRRRLAESFEWFLDAERGRERLLARLWEVVRGPALSARPPAEAEVGRRYVALLAENLGQPGFRELILRTADLEIGGALSFVLLADAPRAAFAAARARGLRSRLEGLPGAVDLKAERGDGLLVDAVMTGLLPCGAPVQRVALPRGGTHGGETHRLAEGTLVTGCGLAESLAAGAEQVIIVAGTPEAARVPARRRGPRSLWDGVLATLERQALEPELATAERINRMVETMGHRTEDGGRAWKDPSTGRTYRTVDLYVIRPDRRALGPLELDGARDPATEALETPGDLLERGYRDAYRMFVEPVVGAVPEPRPAPVAREEGQPVEL
jgi:hypothetical protein